MEAFGSLTVYMGPTQRQTASLRSHLVIYFSQETPQTYNTLPRADTWKTIWDGSRASGPCSGHQIPLTQTESKLKA